MPFLSKAQNAWGHSASGVKALGGTAKVKEWEGATDYKHLPEKKAPKKSAFGGAIKLGKE